MKIITDEKKVDEILSKGVEDIFVKESLKKKLLSGRVLRIKFGIDPTGPKIHLGRTIPLKKLRQFQDLGHKAVLIVGDFTAMIGDPSDKLDKRPMLTEKRIKANMRDYEKQLGKIIDLKTAEFYYNSKWLKKLNALEISNLAESFSVQQMSNRRNFKDRLQKEEEISLREFLYPLYQGYDSVMVKADVEIGGFDQLFNLKAGRIIQKHYGQPEQDILTCQMLEGTDGRKMSTSWGNLVTVVDEPNDMFGKIMALRDELVPKYFKLCTNIIEAEFLKKKNPRDQKMQLAHEIVRIYHGEKKAEASERNFIKTFQKKEIPDEMPKVKLNDGEKLMQALVREKILSSKSDFRRLIKEGAILDLMSQSKITDPNFVPRKGNKFKIGKKKFVEIV